MTILQRAHPFATAAVPGRHGTPPRRPNPHSSPSRRALSLPPRGRVYTFVHRLTHHGTPTFTISLSLPHTSLTPSLSRCSTPLPLCVSLFPLSVSLSPLSLCLYLSPPPSLPLPLPLPLCKDVNDPWDFCVMTKWKSKKDLDVWLTEPVYKDLTLELDKGNGRGSQRWGRQGWGVQGGGKSMRGKRETDMDLTMYCVLWLVA